MFEAYRMIGNYCMCCYDNTWSSVHSGNSCIEDLGFVKAYVCDRQGYEILYLQSWVRNTQDLWTNYIIDLICRFKLRMDRWNWGWFSLMPLGRGGACERAGRQLRWWWARRSHQFPCLCYTDCYCNTWSSVHSGMSWF